MTEPLSWLAVQYIKGRMSSIAPGSGYYSDFSTARVLDDRSQIDASEGVGTYLLVVATDFEPTGESAGRASQVYSEDMSLLIEYGIRRDPSLSPELQVHRARADVIRALRSPLRNQVHGLIRIDIGTSSIVDTPEDSALIIAQVQARAGLSDTTPPAS